MRDLLFGITALSLLFGCSAKDEDQFLKTYEKNKAYHIELQKTEKTTLKEGRSTKALLTATYLFRETEDLNDTRDEKFIVGLYLDDDEGSFESGDYNLTLNAQRPKSVKALAQNDIRLKKISLASEWTQFYLFTFPHTKRKSFKLIFESKVYGKGELHFAKVPKYVLTKTPF